MAGPLKKFIAGSVSATLWRNKTKTAQGGEIEYTTVQIDRRYKDKDNTWKSTNNMRLNDVPKAVMVLQKAYEFLILRSDDNKIEEDSFDEIVM